MELFFKVSLFWLHCVFADALGLSLAVVSRDYSSSRLLAVVAYSSCRAQARVCGLGGHGTPA